MNAKAESRSSQTLHTIAAKVRLQAALVKGGVCALYKLHFWEVLVYG